MHCSKFQAMPERMHFILWRTSLIADICRFWNHLVIKALKSTPKWEYIRNKLAKIGLSRPKFCIPYAKSTPAVLTNLSYEQHLKKFVEISPSLFLSPAHHQYEDQYASGLRCGRSGKKRSRLRALVPSAGR